MTTKFTLGPLGSFAQAAYGHGIAPINSAGHRSGEFIAVVHFADKSHGQSTDGQKAYARLFSAAPELLNVAQWARDAMRQAFDEVLESIPEGGVVPPWMATLETTIADAEHAIAKAKGDQA